jgi:glycosyltransferase involved in cell wall biosynthesis
LNILHIIPYYIRATKTGGPAIVVNQLAKALQLEGHSNQIVTSTGNLDEEIDIPFSGDLFETLEDRVATIYLRRKNNILPATFYFAPLLQRWLLEHIDEFEVVFIHGVWTYFSWMGAKICQKRNVPYVYFIHGSFDPWAMKHHGIKKLPYWYLVEKPNFKKASGIIVLSQDEAAQVRNLGIDKSIFHAKNGILFPIPRVLDAEKVLKNNIPLLDSHPFVCSISRLHPKKGLEVLIKSWKILVEDYPELRLVIAGPDEGGYQAQLTRLVHQFGLEHTILFPGFVEGELKEALFEKAALFVLPSFSEGVPGSVIEAMAYGNPVVITPYCHLPEVGEAHAGIIVEPEVYNIASALGNLMSNEGLRKQMGINGQKLARDHFDLVRIAADLVSYLRILLVQ